MGRVTATLRRRGLQRGVLGTSRAWLAIWATLSVGRLLRRLTRPRPIVERFELKPGDTLVISDLGKPSEQ
jgi:hypothetical protein